MQTNGVRQREWKYAEPLPQRPNNEANLQSIAKMRKYKMPKVQKDNETRALKCF